MWTIHEPEVRSILLDDTGLQEMVIRLKARKRKTASLDEIWSAFVGIYKGIPSGRERRLWLWTVLKELDGAGEVVLPVRHGKLWDRTSDVPLPTRITFRSDGSNDDSTEWRTFAWHPQLQWVLGRRFISSPHVAFLKRVNHGIIEGWFKESEPLKYRSLQLTGDEKLLAKFAKTKLFGSGQLSLEQLGCESEVLPIAFERISNAPSMLMFENAASFMLARRIAREIASSGRVQRFGAIAYGAGKQAVKSVKYLPMVDPRVETVLYVGDLDAEGLLLAAELKKRSNEVSIEPATAFHAAMLRSAAELGAPDGWLAKDGQPRILARRGLDFPDPSLRSACARIVESGRRVPEEVLSTKPMMRLISQA